MSFHVLNDKDTVTNLFFIGKPVVIRRTAPNKVFAGLIF